MRHWLRLARVPFAPTAVFDAVACAWLALQVAPGTDPGALRPVDYVVLVVAPCLLYVAGMAGNDWFDRKRDETLAPMRPIPSGAIDPGRALTLWVTALLGGVVLAGYYFGLWMPLFAAASMLAYNAGLKRSAFGGALGMAGVRAGNAALVAGPLVFNGHAPVWVLAGPLCLGLYSAAITLMSTTEDGRHLERRWMARLVSAAAFGSAAALAWIASANPWPTLGSVVAFGVVTSSLFGRTPRPGPPKRMVLEMLLGFYFLEYVLASAAWDGSPIVAFGGLAVTFGAIYVSRWMIRRLFVTKAASPSSDPDA